MKTKKINKLWGAAFTKKPDVQALAFTAGRDVVAVPPADSLLAPYDVWVNQAHCIMLAKQGIIPKSDAKKLLAGLAQVDALVQKHAFPLDPTKEDIHTNIESYLTQKLGIEVAGNLHTARSRNDQTNADTRLYLRDCVLSFVIAAADLAAVLAAHAKKYKATIMPGFTHHQHAMVTSWGHVVGAFAGMIVRDAKRFMHWYDLHNTSPLRNSVGYGTQFPIDQKLTAVLLAFDGPDLNSMDEITNRWEAESDLAFAVTVLMNHLSLIAQTLILFATPEFGFITLADAYATGSSIMPQKKNPDTLEAIKGKAAYAAGILSGILSSGKSSFIGFNRDSQWTKYMSMDMVSECLPAPAVMAGIFKTLTVHKDQMAVWSTKGYIGATSLMEHMISTFGIPMRQAKVIVEKAVKKSAGSDMVTHAALGSALADEGFQLPISEHNVIEWQDPQEILACTSSFGGPGQKPLAMSLALLKRDCAKIATWHTHKIQAIASAKELTRKGLQI
jgi:argininosuccinate lyase